MLPKQNICCFFDLKSSFNLLDKIYIRLNNHVYEINFYIATVMVFWATLKLILQNGFYNTIDSENYCKIVYIFLYIYLNIPFLVFWISRTQRSEREK